MVSKKEIKKKLKKKIKLYYDKKKKMRYIKGNKGKRMYIDSGKSNSQIVKVIVNNLIKRAPARRDTTKTQKTKNVDTDILKVQAIANILKPPQPPHQDYQQQQPQPPHQDYQQQQPQPQPQPQPQTQQHPPQPPQHNYYAGEYHRRPSDMYTTMLHGQYPSTDPYDRPQTFTSSSEPKPHKLVSVEVEEGEDYDPLKSGGFWTSRRGEEPQYEEEDEEVERQRLERYNQEYIKQHQETEARRAQALQKQEEFRRSKVSQPQEDISRSREEDMRRMQAVYHGSPNIVEEAAQVQTVIPVQQAAQVQTVIPVQQAAQVQTVIPVQQAEEVGQPIERGDPAQQSSPERLMDPKKEEEDPEKKGYADKPPKEGKPPTSKIPKEPPPDYDKTPDRFARMPKNKDDKINFMLKYMKIGPRDIKEFLSGEIPQKPHGQFTEPELIRKELIKYNLQKYVDKKIEPKTAKEYQEMSASERLHELNEILNKTLALYILRADKNTNQEVEAVRTARENILQSYQSVDKSRKIGLKLLADSGYGNETNKQGGLTDSEINEMMKHYTQFKGCFHADDIKKIKPVGGNSAFGFCVLVPWGHAGHEGHWVAVYVDPKNKSIEYYDPFGEPPKNSVNRDLKTLVERIDDDHLFQYKVNRIKNQRANSDSCGFHSMKFIIDRIKGLHFKDASGYSTIMKSEEDVKKMKNKVKKFGYL